MKKFILASHSVELTRDASFIGQKNPLNIELEGISIAQENDEWEIIIKSEKKIRQVRNFWTTDWNKWIFKWIILKLIKN